MGPKYTYNTRFQAHINVSLLKITNITNYY
jgi:hypothetical protein